MPAQGSSRASTCKGSRPQSCPGLSLAFWYSIHRLILLHVRECCIEKPSGVSKSRHELPTSPMSILGPLAASVLQSR